MDLIFIILKLYLDLFLIVFIDDILVYSCGIFGPHCFRDGVRVYTQKREAVQIVSRQTSPTDIRSFSSFSIYYGRFVEGFSSISSLFTKLTQKTVKVQWSKSCEKSFQELKK